MKDNLSLDAVLVLTSEIALVHLVPRAEKIFKSGKWSEKQFQVLQKALLELRNAKAEISDGVVQDIKGAGSKTDE